MQEVILSIIAGLGLFLFAVRKLSEHLTQVFSENATQFIQQYTANTVKAIGVGIITTILLDSSSAVIILTIIFVNSKLLTLRQAMGIVLGANIGTTVSSQIIALEVSKYSPLFLCLGLLILFFAKTEKIKQIANSILYFGILFFGLLVMENAVEPLKDESFFMEAMQKAENPVWGSLLGAIVTLIIQSSSATVGMAIVLTKKGLLSLSGGIAIMLGSELGTCADTLMATFRGSRQAVKTGIFHLTFNLLSIVLGLLLFYPFVTLVSTLSAGAAVERTLANAHMFFNIFGVIIFLGTIPGFERLLNKLIPDN